MLAGEMDINTSSGQTNSEHHHCASLFPLRIRIDMTGACRELTVRRGGNALIDRPPLSPVLSGYWDSPPIILLKIQKQ